MSFHRVIAGDCLSLLPTLEAGSVEAVVSDVPYGVGYAPWDATIPPQSVLADCLRISTGPVVWFGAASTEPLLDFATYEPRPDRMLVWTPAMSLASSRDSRIFYRWHPIWIWRPPERQSEIESDVLRDNCEGRHWWDHPATKPQSLMIKLVRAFCPEGGTVLDPFGGSGTTAVAAKMTGRNSITIEIDEGYCAIARRRIADAASLFHQEPA